MRDLRRLASFGIIIPVVAAGCGAATKSSLPTQSASNTTLATVSPRATSSARVANPFTIIARFSPASLGLKRPKACGGGGGGGCNEELAIGPDGNLYVTDAVSATVTVVSPAGKVLRRWGGPGTGPGQFTFVTKDLPDPNDIAASITVGPDGKVYVSDSGNGRVEVFSPKGTFIRQVCSYGYDHGQFLLPYDLAVDSSGNLYVADDQLSMVSKFSPGGQFIWRVGGSEATDPDLRGEFHLASVDSHGRVVTTSDTQEAILYIDGKGRKVEVFRTTGDFPAPDVGPCNVTVDAPGNTFVMACGGPNTTGRVASPPYQFELVFDRAHHLVGAWYDSPFVISPRFGPHGEAFTLGDDGSILKLKVALPGA